MDCGVEGQVGEGYGVDGAGTGGFEGCGEGLGGCRFSCGGRFAREGVCLFGEDVLEERKRVSECPGLGEGEGGSSYGTLGGIFPWIANVVGGEFDEFLVEGGEEGFGEGDFGHDVFVVAGVEGFLVESW